MVQVRRTALRRKHNYSPSGGLQLWLNDQKEGQITSSYDFNAASPNPDIVYVEGTQTGEGSIMLNWQKNATSAPQLMDTVYYNVWQITGAQNVPGYGKYIYNASLP
jgi:1-acyl-sn-glycerol-3-phosphate acyltransferase